MKQYKSTFKIARDFSTCVHGFHVPKNAAYGTFQYDNFYVKYICTSWKDNLRLYIWDFKAARWKHADSSHKRLFTYVNHQIDAHNLRGIIPQESVTQFLRHCDLSQAIRKHKCNNSFPKGGPSTYFGPCDKSNMVRTSGGEYDFKMRMTNNIVYF